MKLKLFLCGFLVTGVLRADTGHLHQFEDKMNSPATSSPAKDSDSDHNQREHSQINLSDDCTEDDCPDLLSPLYGLIFGSPFYIPALAIGDTYKTYPLNRYPYARNDRFLTSTGKSWLIRASGSRLWSAHAPAWSGELSLFTASRFGVDSSYTRYNEHIGDELDSLSFVDVIPTYSFARTEEWDWRAGMGYESVDGRDHHDRFKLVYNVKYFFARPWRLDADLATSLASSKPIFQLSTGIAWQWNRYEVKLAYQRRSISDVVLEGPQLSLAIWF